MEGALRVHDGEPALRNRLHRDVSESHGYVKDRDDC
jgi:hypothetical protein